MSVRTHRAFVHCIVCLLYVWVFVRVYIVFHAICIFLLNFHLYGHQFIHRIQCFTCHAANAHSLIHMNVWSTTAAAAEKKSQTHFLTRYQPNSQPVSRPANSLSLNKVKFYTIITEPNCKLVHISQKCEKTQCTQCTWRVRENHFDNLCILCLHLSVPKCNRFMLCQTIVNNFSSAKIEVQHATLIDIF